MVYRHRKSNISFSSSLRNEEEFVMQKGQKVPQDELVLMHRKKVKYPQDDTEFYSNIWTSQPSKYSTKQIDIIQVAHTVSRRIDYREDYEYHPSVIKIKNLWDTSLDEVLDEEEEEMDGIFIPPRDSDVVSKHDYVIQRICPIEPETEPVIVKYESLQQCGTVEDPVIKLLQVEKAGNNKKNCRRRGLFSFFQNLIPTS